MAVAFSVERADDADTTNATSYVIGGAFTPAADTLLVCVIAMADNAATWVVSTVAGGNLTWVNSGLTVTVSDAVAYYRTEVWYALVGASPESTTVTVTPSEGLTGCIGWIGEFTGHNTTTPIKQIAELDQVASSDPSVSLGAAPDSDSQCIAGAQSSVAAGWAAEAGWTEHQAAAIINPAMTVGVWANTTTPDQSFTATGTDAIHSSWIMEIDAAAGGVTGTGGVVATAAQLAGTGTETISGTGALTTVAASLSGAGTETIAGSGGIAASAAVLSGSGAETISGTGALAAAAASFAGTGAETFEGTGAFGAAAAVLSGAGEVLESITGTGGITAAAAALAGTGEVLESITGAGGIVTTPASLSGLGAETFEGTGALAASPAALSGTGLETIDGTGSFAASPASLSGEGTETIAGSGDFSTMPASLSGTGAVGDDPAPISGTGAFEALAAQFSGTGAVQAPEIPVVTGGGGFSQPWRPTPKKKVKKIKGRGAFAAAPASFSGFGDVEDVIAREDEELLLLV